MWENCVPSNPEFNTILTLLVLSMVYIALQGLSIKRLVVITFLPDLSISDGVSATAAFTTHLFTASMKPAISIVAH